ncbi:MAG: hypothetical protein CMH54_13675 [Myxococcales bacterium]|nr:hypothetical protein [Myxococcales bacterium]
MKHFLSLILSILLCTACLDKDEFIDPVPDVSDAQDSSATDEGPAPTDEGPAPTDEGPAPTDEGPAPSDEGDATETTEEDTAATDEGPAPTDEGPAPSDEGDTSETTEEDTTATDSATTNQCLCRFFYPGTDPVLQDYVWLTGDLVDPAWSTDPNDGAIALTYDEAQLSWIVDVSLEDGQLVEYKYLMCWADNDPAICPQWVTQDGNFDTGAGNSTLLVECGTAPCDQ